MKKKKTYSETCVDELVYYGMFLVLLNSLSKLSKSILHAETTVFYYSQHRRYERST